MLAKAAVVVMHLLAESAWALLAKLLTRALFEKVLKKLTVSGLERLAASTENALDDDIVKDVKLALDADTQG